MSSPSFPDPLILSIILESDVFTLKSLRLVCRNFHALVQAYGKSIKAKLLHPLYSNNLTKCFKLAWHEQWPVRAIFDIDQRIRTARWMAALALKHGRHPKEAFENRKRLAQYGLIDQLDMWEHITMGLGIMWRLAEFSLQDQISHIRTLTDMQRMYLAFSLNFCLEEMFSKRSVFEEYDEYGNFKIPYEQTRAQYTWAKGFILRKGPYFIAAAWKSDDGKAVCKDLLVNEIRRKSWDEIQGETELVEEYYETIEKELPLEWTIDGPVISMIATEDEERVGWVKAEYAEASKEGRLAFGRPKKSLVRPGLLS